MMRHESSIVELGEIASGVAIAASIREISVLSRSNLRSVRASQRSQEVLGLEELLSELIARARMLRPHLGSRLVSAPLTFGVHCRTLSGEERCGRMIANPVKSTSCTQLPERMGADESL